MKKIILTILCVTSLFSYNNSEKQTLKKVGFSKYDIDACSKQNIDITKAIKWKSLNVECSSIKKFKQYNITLKQVKLLNENKINMGWVLKFYQNEYGNYKEIIQWKQAGFDLYLTIKYFQANIPLKDAKKWEENGVVGFGYTKGLFTVKEAIEWKQADISSYNAIEIKKLHITLKEAKLWYRSDIYSSDIPEYMYANFSLQEAIALDKVLVDNNKDISDFIELKEFFKKNHFVISKKDLIKLTKMGVQTYNLDFLKNKEISSQRFSNWLAIDVYPTSIKKFEDNNIEIEDVVKWKKYAILSRRDIIKYIKLNYTDEDISLGKKLANQYNIDSCSKNYYMWKEIFVYSTKLNKLINHNINNRDKTLLEMYLTINSSNSIFCKK